MRHALPALALLLLLSSPVLAEEPAPAAPAAKPEVVLPEPWVKTDALTIHRFQTTCNTYFLTCARTGKFVVVDAGAGILPAIREHVADGHELAALWITHDHGDHLSGLGELEGEFEVLVVAHQEAREAIAGVREHWKEWGMTEVAPKAPPMPNTWISDGATFKVGELEAKALFAPGHSVGSVCYLVADRYLFAGDVLFKGSVGRTDFPGCDHERFCRSLSEKLWDLPDEVEVFPGHMDRTTMGEEKKTNWLFQDYVRAHRGLPAIPRPWIGIGTNRERREPGLELTQVAEGSPAEAAGLKPGDVILAFGDAEMKGIRDLLGVLRRCEVGQVVKLKVKRGEEHLELDLKLGTRPPPATPR
jgi:hydroxyacylglutathione hydrolase